MAKYLLSTWNTGHLTHNHIFSTNKGTVCFKKNEPGRQALFILMDNGNASKHNITINSIEGPIYISTPKAWVESWPTII